MQIEVVQPTFRRTFCVGALPQQPLPADRKRLCRPPRIVARGELVISTAVEGDNWWTNPRIDPDGTLDLSECYLDIQSGRGQIVNAIPGTYPAYAKEDEDEWPSGLFSGGLCEVIAIGDVIVETDKGRFQCGFQTIEPIN